VDGSGRRGIVGMRERARLLGGTLDAGPLPDGGFRVRADLPLEPVA
jgi:signal transduction histidine kinase